jgi:hypothetical protein
VEDKYQDPDFIIREIDDQIFEAVIELDATLAALSAHLIEVDCYQGFLRHLERIDRVLPTTDYDFKDLLGQIGEDKPTKQIYECLKGCVARFADGDYEGCLHTAQECNDFLIKDLRDYGRIRFGKSAPSFGEFRNLLKGTQGPRESNYRLEWLVVSLLEVTTFMRHFVAHSVPMDNLPKWMKERRSSVRLRAESARLMLLCQLHAALELEHLWHNEAPEWDGKTHLETSNEAPPTPSQRAIGPSPSSPTAPAG